MVKMKKFGIAPGKYKIKKWSIKRCHTRIYQKSMEQNTFESKNTIGTSFYRKVLISKQEGIN